MHYKRMTRVICTIGPSSANPKIIKRLIEQGLNIARLNFSHGSRESHKEVIDMVRSAASDMGRYVGILQDLQGPKIRMGMLPEDGVCIVSGGLIALKSGGEYEQGVLPVNYPNLYREVSVGEDILLSDGLIELEVEKIEGERVFCRIINGGELFSRKGVNLPQSKLSISSFSEKDREDLAFGLSCKVDFVALSFVRSREDLIPVRQMLDATDYSPKLIAKIEKPQAVENINSILDSVDAVMVARGDLGVEMPLERVPIIQKDIITTARKAGKDVIIATQMLMSMVSSVRPTRGEVSDVANAVFDGADAVMLSDESANGKYPVEACAMLGKIASFAETARDRIHRVTPAPINTEHPLTLALGRAACSVAADVEAEAILVFTFTGYTARAVAQFRPHCPIIAITPNENVCRQLTLSWGILPVLAGPFTDTDSMFNAGREVALSSGLTKKGDTVVLTSGSPKGRDGSTTLVRVLTV